MAALRNLILARRHAGMIVMLAAMAMRALLPQGMMVESRNLVLTITICADTTASHSVRKLIVPRSGNDAPRETDRSKGAACPFSVQGAADLGAVPAELVLAAEAFRLATGHAPQRKPRLQRPEYRQPPLRGPPTQA